MIVIYQNAEGKEVRFRNIIHLQNIEDGKLEVLTSNGREYILRFDRVEAIADESLFKEKEENKQ